MLFFALAALLSLGIMLPWLSLVLYTRLACGGNITPLKNLCICFSSKSEYVSVSSISSPLLLAADIFLSILFCISFIWASAANTFCLRLLLLAILGIKNMGHIVSGICAALVSNKQKLSDRII